MADLWQLLNSSECLAALGLSAALLYWIWPRPRSPYVRRVAKNRNGQGYWKEREKY
jgi:hypothetical protein